MAEAMNTQAAADAAERLDDVALREWLDARQAEVERDHRDGWTGRTCYCDVPKPCADRAYELAAINAMRELLVDRVRMAAELEQANAATAEQRAETYWLVERGEEMRDALTVATELIDRLARSTPCDIDHNGHCVPHRVREAPLPCPHPLGRRFVEAWRAVQSEATEKGPESHAEDPAPSPRPTPGG